MKLFILTHCAAEDNYTPRVFQNKTDAILALNKSYDELVYERDADGEVLCVYGSVYEYNIEGFRAEITYADDTYDVFEIFEVEVE